MVAEVQRFHPLVVESYQAVHKWLDKHPSAKGYKRIKYDELVKKLRNQPEEITPPETAAQFHIFMPTHSFKVQMVLTELLESERIAKITASGSYIVLIDVGCGGGAASSAMINTLLSVQPELPLPAPIHVFVVGLDPDTMALVIFDRFMRNIEQRLDTRYIQLEHRCVYKGIPEGVLDVGKYVIERRQLWGQPYLSRVILAQVNIVSPLDQSHRQNLKKRQELLDAGISPDVLGSANQPFGETEAQAYLTLLKSIDADEFSIITVGTESYLWEQRVREMGHALGRVFGAEHNADDWSDGEKQHVDYENPAGGYWRKELGHSDFHVDLKNITSRHFSADRQWRDVISEPNLYLAWARVRAAALRESLIDEIEIRLFEARLDKNLQTLRDQLAAYAHDVAKTDQRLFYAFPKTEDRLRPRTLSRLQEEILAVALIQVLGVPVSALKSRSYAHRIDEKERNTEFLYENWVQAYKQYVNDVRESVAKQSENAVVLQTDIQSFYVKIVQRHLTDLAAEEMRASQSQRVIWLLRQLLLRDLDDGHHDSGRGLTQGGTASGFFANTYLARLDILFRPGNEWGVEFFRYADDMILVIPDPKNAALVWQKLEETLVSLDLSPSVEKTKISSRDDYLRDSKPDELLDMLDQQSKRLINSLFAMNQDYRTRCQVENEWWPFVSAFQEYLSALEIHVKSPRLSRKIQQYLHPPIRERNQSEGAIRRLKFPELPLKLKDCSPAQWAQEFRDSNPDWVFERNDVQLALVATLRESWFLFQQAHGAGDLVMQRLHQARIRFTLTRLGIFGYEHVLDVVEDILTCPWVVRNPHVVLEGLAQQGFVDTVLHIVQEYTVSDHTAASYLRAIALRTLRFLPFQTPSSLNTLHYYAVSQQVPVVEKLMALETLIYIDCIPEIDFSQLKQQYYENRGLSPRLAKNLLLLILKCCPEIMGNNSFPDEMYDDALYLSTSATLDEYLQTQEPDILRKNYYNAEYPDATEDAPY